MNDDECVSSRRVADAMEGIEAAIGALADAIGALADASTRSLPDEELAKRVLRGQRALGRRD